MLSSSPGAVTWGRVTCPETHCSDPADRPEHLDGAPAHPMDTEGPQTVALTCPSKHRAFPKSPESSRAQPAASSPCELHQGPGALPAGTSGLPGGADARRSLARLLGRRSSRPCAPATPQVGRAPDMRALDPRSPQPRSGLLLCVVTGRSFWLCRLCARSLLWLAACAVVRTARQRPAAILALSRERERRSGCAPGHARVTRRVTLHAEAMTSTNRCDKERLCLSRRLTRHGCGRARGRAGRGPPPPPAAARRGPRLGPACGSHRPVMLACWSHRRSHRTAC